jgi:hypothetical protein
MPGLNLEGQTPFNPILIGSKVGGVFIHNPLNVQVSNHWSDALKAKVMIKDATIKDITCRDIMMSA